jgi:hypothetical protein
MIALLTVAMMMGPASAAPTIMVSSTTANLTVGETHRLSLKVKSEFDEPMCTGNQK